MLRPMGELAKQLPDWSDVQYLRVPLEYQGYLRLVHSIHMPKFIREKRESVRSKRWSRSRRDALIKKYAADIGLPLSERTMRHVAPHHGGGYIVRFMVDGRTISLGCFKVERDACEAWDAWMRAWIDGGG